MDLKVWFVRKREFIIFILISVIIGLATYKYVAHGESYRFETYISDEKIQINSNTIRQDIIVDEKSVWDKYSYALYLYTEHKVKEGTINVHLRQNGRILESIEIMPHDLVTGWCVFDGFRYRDLKPGTATLEISSRELDQVVALGVCRNTYNLPNCFLNGIDTGYTLTQRYHYNFNNYEYKLRCMAFAAFLSVNIGTIYLVWKKKDTGIYAGLARLSLTISYLCLVFIYDSSLWLSPTWAEAVGNFMHSGINFPLRVNLLLTDAGYLPLFQRLVALSVIKGFRLSAYRALFCMQALAYVFSGYLLSFFASHRFSGCFSLKYRYALSLLFMMQIISRETGAFINFATYGFLVIFFYYLADSREWSRKEFVFLCACGCLVCMSKGIYVTILPFMVVCIILFYRNYFRRDFIFSGVCAAGALLQLVYYINAGSDWLDRSDSAKLDNYYGKLVLQSLIDVPNNILAVFLKNIDFFNGISILMIIVFWIIVIFMFGKYVIKPYIKKQPIDRNIQVFFMMIIFIAAQSLFFRITVYGVSASDIGSDVFWLFRNSGIDNRYQISIHMAVAALVVASIRILSQSGTKNIQGKSVLVLVACLMIANPKFQLKGIGNDDYVYTRSHISDMEAEYNLIQGIEKTPCRVVPIQPNRLIYNKNADIYCFGNDIFKWKNTVCIPSEDPGTGYLRLDDYPEVNSECGIWQIFINKNNLVQRNDYQILLLDAAGKVLAQKSQDNSNYQRIASFTFENRISGVSEIRIMDAMGKRVYIDNALYMVTDAGAEFLEK